MPGITFDPTRNLIYTAMSAVRQGMEDNASKGAASTRYDLSGANDVRVTYNECGCVYKMEVDPVTYLGALPHSQLDLDLDCAQDCV